MIEGRADYRDRLRKRLVFGCGVGLPVQTGGLCCPGRLGEHRLDPRRGGPLSRVAGMARTGQAGVDRVRSRRQ